jgi:hypothetical protein
MSTPLPVPAEAANNTQLFLGTDVSPSVFSIFIARIGDIATNQSVKTVDVSNQQSNWIRKLATMHDGGTVTFPLFWLPGEAEDQDLADVYASTPPKLRSYMLQWPDGKQWFFNAYFTKWAAKAPVQGALTADLELTIDGVVQM